MAIGAVTSALVSFSAAHGVMWKEVVILGRRVPSKGPLEPFQETLGMAMRLDRQSLGIDRQNSGNGSNGNGTASGKSDVLASGKNDRPASGNSDRPASGTEGPASVAVNGSSAVQAMAPKAMNASREHVLER